MSEKNEIEVTFQPGTVEVEDVPGHGPVLIGYVVVTDDDPDQLSLFASMEDALSHVRERSLDGWYVHRLAMGEQNDGESSVVACHEDEEDVRDPADIAIDAMGPSEEG